MNRTRKQKNQLAKFLQLAGMSNQEIENEQGRKNIPAVHQQAHKTIIKKEKNKKKSFKGLGSLGRLKKTSYQSEKKKQINQVKEEVMMEQEIDLTHENCILPLKLEKIIQKIPIVKMESEKVIEGCFGHSTIIFKRPIIQGSYYIQFKPLPPKLTSDKNKITNSPSIRLGISPFEYLLTVPIGHQISVGYKINSSEIVVEGKVQPFGSQIEMETVIGVQYHFVPPQKYQNKELNSKGSKLSFYKNGELMAQFDSIKQAYFCPAFSLYNYARVEVRHHQEDMEYLPENAIPYGQIFIEPIQYEDLKKTMIFSDFVQK